MAFDTVVIMLWHKQIILRNLQKITQISYIFIHVHLIWTVVNIDTKVYTQVYIRRILKCINSSVKCIKITMRFNVLIYIYIYIYINSLSAKQNFARNYALNWKNNASILRRIKPQICRNTTIGPTKLKTRKTITILQKYFVYKYRKKQSKIVYTIYPRKY